MMSLREQDIKNYFSETIFKRGMEYFKEGNVRLKKTKDQFIIKKIRGQDVLEALVVGSETYRVWIPVDGNEMTKDSLDGATCTCPYFQKTEWECKHIVAATLEYLKETPTVFVETKNKVKNSKKSVSSNFYGQKLLQKYTKNDLVKGAKGEIALIPRICELDTDYPYLSFTVGLTKKYVVKRVDYFLEHLYEGNFVEYGKDLKFTHHISAFDEVSQKLINIINGQNNQRELYFSGRSTNHFANGNRAICLDSNSLKLFFQLFLGQTVEIDDWDCKEVLLQEGDPEVFLNIEKVEGGARISLASEEVIVFFGDEYDLYALNGSSFFKCSPTFTEKISPLVSVLGEEIFVSEQDLPTFCAMVLKEVQDVLIVEDDDGVCEEFIPDDCIACFYFDTDMDLAVIAELKFRYGEIEIGENPTKKQLNMIRRNVQEEEKSKMILQQYFYYDLKEKNYVLAYDEELFYTSYLNKFREYGEVFLSQSMNGMFIDNKTKPVLGISVSDGLLNLDMDTGEFPAEELEALYNSFLKKKKYHRLKDGRFLFLDDSGYEKVAEISHMLQLSPHELKNNQIVLPAHRGLYLDSVLEGNDRVDSTRNLAFRRMMKDFKSVVDSDYQPSELLQTTLRHYQIVGFQWMKTLEQYGFGGILADEMGLGKTVQVITFLLSISESGSKNSEGKPSLVVCPASLLLNWGEELARFAPSLKVMLILGTAKERKSQIESDEGKSAEVWVTSYDLLKRDRESYEEKVFYCCILDEAQNVKNQSTLVSKTVKSINCQQRFVLTGTPIENRLSELWNLFDYLMPGYLFSHNAFVSKLEKPIVQSEESSAGRQLSLLVKPFIMRRLKKDVLQELPDKMEHIRKIHLSEEERKVYAATMNRVRSEAAETQNKLQILALLTHLRQLCCDPNLCFENYQGESSKLDACLELCRSMVANGHKILLFSQFTSMLDLIRHRLTEERISHLTIEGATSKEKRAKYVKEFQNGQADVFLISLKAGGTGLNLTNADVVIHYDPWWNQAAQNQATDRAHRIGQKQHVQVYKLIAQGTIEEKILALQEKKASLMDAVFMETGDETLSREDILALLE